MFESLHLVQIILGTGFSVSFAPPKDPSRILPILYYQQQICYMIKMDHDLEKYLSIDFNLLLFWPHQYPNHYNQSHFLITKWHKTSSSQGNIQSQLPRKTLFLNYFLIPSLINFCKQLPILLNDPSFPFYSSS